MAVGEISKNVESKLRWPRRKFITEGRYCKPSSSDLIDEIRALIPGISCHSHSKHVSTYLQSAMEKVGFSVKEKRLVVYVGTDGKRHRGFVDLFAMKEGIGIAIEINKKRPSKASFCKLRGCAASRVLLVACPERPIDLSLCPKDIQALMELSPTPEQCLKPTTIQSATSEGKGQGKGDYRGIGMGRGLNRERSERSDDLLRSVASGASEATVSRMSDRARTKGAMAAAQERIRAVNAAAKSAARAMAPTTDELRMLDQTGKPIVSFDPGNKQRKVWLEVLDRDSNSRERKALISKIGCEFSRIYERFRREIDRRERGGIAGYRFTESPGERRACEDIGILCLRRSITPRQLLEYWNIHVRDFTDGRLRVPSLNFLRVSANVDRVATGKLSEPVRAKSERALSIVRPIERNTFSATAGLDVRIRPTLEKAGFDTTMYSDRYLMSIQHNAVAIAEGHPIFLPDGGIRKMIKCVVHELFRS